MMKKLKQHPIRIAGIFLLVLSVVGGIAYLLQDPGSDTPDIDVSNVHRIELPPHTVVNTYELLGLTAEEAIKKVGYPSRSAFTTPPRLIPISESENDEWLNGPQSSMMVNSICYDEVDGQAVLFLGVMPQEEVTPEKFDWLIRLRNAQTAGGGGKEYTELLDASGTQCLSTGLPVWLEAR